MFIPQRKLSENSVFYNGYRERNVIEYLKRYGRQWKFAYQRAMRGYCDADVWNMKGWFLSVMPAMLNQLGNTTHSCPVAPTGSVDLATKAVCLSEDGEQEPKAMADWRETLRYMSKCFAEADEATCEEKNAYEEAWMQAYKEFEQQYGLFGKRIPDDENAKFGKRMHFPGEFPQWKEIMDKHREEEIRISKYRGEKLKEGFALLEKWFWDLWD